MMKNLLSLLTLLFLYTTVSAQCVAPACTPSATTGYCAVPDTTQNLPATSVGVAYDTDIKFKVANSVQGATVTDLSIDSVSGLPTGFAYSTSPANGIIPGGGNGCINFTGLATSGQEFGGPNNDGVYPLLINVTANVTFFGNPSSIPASIPGYKLVITDPTGIKIISGREVLITPNPAKDELNITTASTDQKQIKIYDALGRVIKNTNDSKSITHLDVSGLNNGIYFIEISSDKDVIVKKFVKE